MMSLFVPIGLDLILIGVIMDRYRDGSAAVVGIAVVRNELGGQPAVLVGLDVNAVGRLVRLGISSTAAAAWARHRSR